MSRVVDLPAPPVSWLDRWRHGERQAAGATLARSVVPPLVAVALWVWGLRAAEPRTMNDYGLLSMFTPLSVVALVVLSVGFLAALRRAASESVLALHLLTYLALIHATPALLYGTLRYSWAWKHVGIVDYVLRFGSVDPDIAVSEIYHNWPGFFAGSALLTSLAGHTDAVGIAVWAPFAFNLLNLLVLRFVLRGLTQDRRVVWLSLWFFFILNWVGQDYFSPQALAYVLYLACLGLFLRPLPRWALVGLFALLAGTIAASHQITPIMLVIAACLGVLRRGRRWYLPVIAAAVTALWALTAARGYTLPHAFELVETFGDPLGNASETLEKTQASGSAQQIVTWGGRAVVLLAGCAAIVGVVRTWRARVLQVEAVLLMVLPGMLVVVTGFGGEVLLRVVLFSAPFIAYLAARAILPRDDLAITSPRLLLVGLLTALLLPGFLLGYYGKERINYFTPAEVAAARWVDEHAVPGSLLVEGDRNYPTQFRNYEYFTYVPISREPKESWSRVLGNPVEVLSEWLSDPRYTDAYLLITRSQQIHVDTLGPMPAGSLSQLEHTLRRSPQFTVAYQTADATVFTLADGGGG